MAASTRARPNRHIAFGASPHRCVGSHLAREEMKVALEEWHRVIPNYRIDTDETLMAQGGLVSLFTLPWRGSGRSAPKRWATFLRTSARK